MLGFLLCMQITLPITYFFIIFFSSEVNNPEGKIMEETLIVHCNFGTKMIDISKNEGCV